MTEQEATEIVESWGIKGSSHDFDGCVEDIMDGWDPVGSKREILLRNEWDNPDFDTE